MFLTAIIIVMSIKSNIIKIQIFEKRKIFNFINEQNLSHIT